MLRTLLKSKIHGATVTQTELTYGGSITIDRDLMDAVDMLDGEQVHVVNCNNGARIVTYVIEGERGSGVICLNGPAARAAEPGDVVHVICYALYEQAEVQGVTAQIAIVGEGNSIAQLK